MVAGKMYRATGLNNRQLSQVKKIVTKNQAFKTKYFALSDQDITNSAPHFSVLSTITEATANEPDERASDQIHVLSLRLSFALQSLAGAGSVANNQARILIVRAKAAVLTSGDHTSFTATPLQELMQVYYDKVHSFGPNLATSPNGAGLSFNKLIKFKRGKIPHLNMSFQNTSTTPYENGLYMYIIPASDTTLLQLNGFSVINWYDKV